ncbi:MAG: thiolase domain-containing protein [Pseudomonadales bacterium]
MREVAIVAWAQTPMVRESARQNENELLMQVLPEVHKLAGLEQKEIDFICSGSCDYLSGSPFSFVMAVDALGATPSAIESHVEMDAAWALYEAWLKIQCGHVDTAMVYGFAKSSPGQLVDIMALQLDPYYTQPLWPDSVSMAALQAQRFLHETRYSEQDMAQVVVDSRAAAMDNPNAQLKGNVSTDELLSEPTFISPLRRHDCCPISDGASALILAERSVAERICERPVYIRGMDHRAEAHPLGSRDLAHSMSSSIAAEKIGLNRDKIDFAELYAPFSHQSLILKEALNLSEETVVNPSGGPLAGHIMMSAGLDRFGEAAMRIMRGEGDRAVAHATSGPCLQQNLLAVLEGV